MIIMGWYLILLGSQLIESLNYYFYKDVIQMVRIIILQIRIGDVIRMNGYMIKYCTVKNCVCDRINYECIKLMNDYPICE